MDIGHINLIADVLKSPEDYPISLDGGDPEGIQEDMASPMQSAATFSWTSGLCASPTP